MKTHTPYLIKRKQFKPLSETKHRNYQELVNIKSNVSGDFTTQETLPIVVRLRQTSDFDSTVTLFNSATAQFIDFNSTDVVITSPNNNVTYNQILCNLISSTFECGFIRLISYNNNQQLLQPWRVTSVNMEGQLVTTVIPNGSSYSPFQNQSNVLDFLYPLKIDSLTRVRFTMLGNDATHGTAGGNNTLDVLFYPNTVTSPVNTLISGNETKKYRIPFVPSVWNTTPVAGAA